uniref:Uncharacterized protein n=1 Tax=Arundo donax TaxID=35708 RepID=A0A0A9A7I8_ARUDO
MNCLVGQILLRLHSVLSIFFFPDKREFVRYSDIHSATSVSKGENITVYSFIYFLLNMNPFIVYAMGGIHFLNCKLFM